MADPTANEGALAREALWKVTQTPRQMTPRQDARFGGSAIAVFGQLGRWRPCADVLENTVKGIETMLRLGEEVARAS